METFEEAVVMSIKAFYAEEGFESFSKHKPSKYTKKYFDDLETEMLIKKPINDKSEVVSEVDKKIS